MRSRRRSILSDFKVEGQPEPIRVAFSGGGTGGHVYPALTVADALRESTAESGPVELLYLGVRGKVDHDLVRRAGIDFHAISASPLRGASLPASASSAVRLAKGTAEAYRILHRFRPDVVFATGGYGSGGAGLAARLLRRPLLLFLPDVEAGIAVRALARFADRIAVTVPPALAAMPALKSTLTGYPVRPAFFAAEREAARAQLGLDAALPVLLVSGASSGASSLNRAIAACAPALLPASQIVHLCGHEEEAWLRSTRATLPLELQERYHLYAYMHDDMALALAAADLAVMRAGASILGELPAARLPAVLVPGEYEGWDQGPNARYLEAKGAAVTLPQSRLGELQSTVLSLFEDEARCEAMKRALAGLARPDAANRLAALVREMAGQAQAAAASVGGAA